MKRKNVMFLLGIIISAIGAVILLYLLDDHQRIKPNGFNRTFIPVTLKVNQVLKADNIYDHIAGFNDQHLYFKSRDPNRLIVTDTNFKNVSYLDLGINTTPNLSPAFFTFLNKSNVSIAGGNVPCLINVDLNIQKSRTFPLKFYFTKVAPLSQNTLIIRTADTSRAIQVFKKLNLATGELSSEQNVSEKIPDGGFSTDGVLNYDTTSNRLFYTYYYKNQFLCLDTNLNLIYKGKTIDTCHTFQVKAFASAKEGTTVFTLKEPPTFVNGASCVHEGKLYISSRLQADNEAHQDFRSNSVIDIYVIKDGTYQGSFYLPNHDNNKAISFSFYHGKLLAIYDKAIVCYTITKNIN